MKPLHSHFEQNQQKSSYPPLRTVWIVVLGFVASLLVFLRLISAVGSGWADIYDDAYISFRYAANLWEGHGLVWNVGEPPTEGFSNLLLVILIAPFTAFGDPLQASRGISALCLIGLGVLLYAVAVGTFGCRPISAALSPLILLLMPATFGLVLVGMETLPYALSLVLAVLAGTRLLSIGTWGSGSVFAVTTFGAMLLRPEAGIVLVVVGVLYIVKCTLGWRAWHGWISALSTLGILLAVYLSWKMAYFGDIFPNPYYIKSSTFGFTESGILSVLDFVSRYWILLGLASFGLLMYPRIGRPNIIRKLLNSAGGTLMVVSLSTAICMIAFFLTADTLADIQGRFLYPVVPLLLILSLPMFQTAGDLLAQRVDKRPVVTIVALTALVIGSSGISSGTLAPSLNPIDGLRAIESIPARLSENRQMQLASALKEFPAIEETRIAYADAGIVPFVSRAKWLDPVGLNDGFIARERDLDALVDYFFSQESDIAILLLDHSGSWVTYGHGPLGDYSAWSSDPRWDEYEYVGSIQRSDTPYDLVFMVNRKSPLVSDLFDFLRKQVVDGWFDSLPVDLGSQMGQPNPVWTSRSM